MAVGESTEHGPVLFEVGSGLDRGGRQALRLWIPLGCLLGIPVVFLRNPEGGVGENLPILGLGYAIVLVVVLLTLAHLKTRFQVTPTHVVKRRVLMPDVAVRRADIVEAVVTPSYAVVGAYGPRALLLDAGGRTLLTSQPMRELSDVEGIAAAAPVVTRVEVLKPEEARERWPRMLPWSHAHPKLGVLAGAGIVLGLIAVGVLVAVLFG